MLDMTEWHCRWQIREVSEYNWRENYVDLEATAAAAYGRGDILLVSCLDYMIQRPWIVNGIRVAAVLCSGVVQQKYARENIECEVKWSDTLLMPRASWHNSSFCNFLNRKRKAMPFCSEIGGSSISSQTSPIFEMNIVMKFLSNKIIIRIATVEGEASSFSNRTSWEVESAN